MVKVGASGLPDPDEGGASELPVIAATEDQAAAVWRIVRASKGINHEEARKKVPSRTRLMLHG